MASCKMSLEKKSSCVCSRKKGWIVRNVLAHLIGPRLHKVCPFLIGWLRKQCAVLVVWVVVLHSSYQYGTSRSGTLPCRIVYEHQHAADVSMSFVYVSKARTGNVAVHFCSDGIFECLFWALFLISMWTERIFSDQLKQSGLCLISFSVIDFGSFNNIHFEFG